MRMLQSANDTADGFFSVLAYVDNNDPMRLKYPEWVHIGEPKHLGPAYQALYEMSDADIVMMCADDLIFRTKGWDTKIKELMPKDLIGVISFDDLGVGAKKEDGHPFIGRKFIEKVGYLCYPLLSHSCVDNWIVSVAKEANCFFYSDIVVEHMHPKYQKGFMDRTYENNSRTIKEEDSDIYRIHGRVEIKKAIERVLA